MTTGIVIVVATLAGILVLAFGRRSRLGDVLGLVGLIATTALAATIDPTDALVLGDQAIVGSLYVRLFVVLGGSAATILAVIALAVGSPTSISGVALVSLAGAAMALSVTDPIIAILASTAAMVAAAVVVADQRSGPRITVAARAFRSTVVAGLLAVGGVVWLATITGLAGGPGEQPLDPGLEGSGSVFGPGLVGLAFLAVAIALAMRLGAIPFHGWAARIAEATPPAGLPATLAVGPGAFAIVVIAWLDGSVGVLGEPLSIERWIVLAIGAASLVFGAVAAWLHDDIEHIVAYSLVQDAGVILLAVAALDPAAWADVRLWVLAVIVVKSALAAWAAATRHAFGTRRVPELGGWARRSPILALAFVIVLVSIVGLPGLAAFEARADLIDLVATGPLAPALLLAALAPVLYLGRILAIGFGPPSARVIAAAGSLPVWPSGAMSAGADGADAPRTPGSAIDAPLRVVRAGAAAWRANRAPAAAVLVLVLAGLGIATAGGGFGAVNAAAEAAPGSGPTGPQGPGDPRESLPPDATFDPGASVDPNATPDPNASGDPNASRDPAPTDSGLETPATGSPGPSSPATSDPSGSPSSSSGEPEPSDAAPGASPPESFAPVPT